MIPTRGQFYMKRGGAVTAIAAASLLLLVPCAAATHAASAVFGGIDIVGSEKGLALTLSADAPFSQIGRAHV